MLLSRQKFASFITGCLLLLCVDMSNAALGSVQSNQQSVADDVSHQDKAPAVVITGFQKINETFDLSNVLNDQSNAIEIGYEDYLIGFDFAVLDKKSYEHTQYKYRLQGLDKEWINARGSSTATYTNLSAGIYRFQVIAMNSNGAWSEEAASIDLIVKPAPWASTFAYVLYIGIATIVLFLLMQLYMQRRDAERIYRHKLEKEVSERTDELQSLNKKLLSASITDQLTGLHNRRYLNEVMPGKAKEVYRRFLTAIENKSATETDGPRLFFIMFDLDGFKAINDTYGHDAGDKVIEEVGTRLQKVCRQEDTIIRWGGDEYMIVGNMSKAREAAALAERVRAAIEQRGFYIDSKEPIVLTSSIGFSQYPFSSDVPSALSWEQVHSLADLALYKSKQAGRNTWTGIVQSNISVSSDALTSAIKHIDSALKQRHVTFFQHNSARASRSSTALEASKQTSS